LPVLTVHHRTTYRYRRLVAFGEHRMMLRPRDSHDQRHLEARLDITPAPVQLRWVHDVFGNNVAIARFSGRAKELTFDSTLRLDHAHQDAPDIEPCLEDYARVYPFSYEPAEMADLLRSIERHYPDPSHQLDRWARSFLRTDGPTSTWGMLTAMTQQIRWQFTYQVRREPGIQSPTETLRRGTGTCRDFAVLMMEAVRCLGLAARFVSGYIHVRGGDVPHVPGSGTSEHHGGGSTHAWLQVYLPGAGWVEFDPTNSIIGSRDLIRVTVVRDARQAIPLAGSWIGAASDCIGMEVAVRVTSDAAETNIG
jgi:transglutaminase-like putative cysteine protease